MVEIEFTVYRFQMVPLFVWEKIDELKLQIVVASKGDSACQILRDTLSVQ